MQVSIPKLPVDADFISLSDIHTKLDRDEETYTLQKNAACKDYQVDEWNPIGKKERHIFFTYDATEALNNYCRGCEVRAICLHRCLLYETRDEKFGTFGVPKEQRTWLKVDDKRPLTNLFMLLDAKYDKKVKNGKD